MKTVALWVLSLSAALLQVPARAEYNGPALDFPMLPWGGVKINVKPGGYRTHQGNSYYAIDFDHLFDAQGRYDGLDDYAVAAADGVVTAIKTGCVAGVLANGCGGYGNNVVVDMGGGYTARYGHFTDVFVAEGPIVRGQILGTIGSTGDSSGPHLHFEVKYNGAGGADVPELEDIEVGGIRFVDYQEVAPRYPPQRLICSDGDCQWSGRLVGDGAAPGIDVLFREAAFKTERFFSTINPRLAGRGAVLGWPKSDASGLVRNVRGVLIQELHQPVDANRMVASDGDTGLALGPDMENRRAFLLRGGFWGVYRCLADAQGRGAGASYLGAPLEEESERYLGVCVPRRYQGDPFYDAYLDMLCRRSTTRQRFERGYMDWSGTQVHVHLNDVDDRRAWEIVNTLEGCYPGFIRNSRESSVVPNPPVAVGQPVTPAVRVVPPVGGQGTLFQEDGAGFSLNGNVRLSFRYPDGHVETVNRVADGRGEYRHSYQSNAGTPVGNYEYWATDLTTGLQSPRVPFSIQRGARYVEGFPYKGSQRPDVCYYTGGTCYVIESEPVYWQMFPGDLGFDRMVVIPQAEFDALVAGAPCVVGAEYDDPAEPGCIIHDESLNGDNDYFVVLNGEARRMNETSARSCFDERRIFNFRLLAWATAWHDDPRPFFTFADQAEAPSYCDPGSPPERVFCDDCGEQERRCNANTCRPFLTECRTQCEAAQACIEGECIEVQRLIAGRIVSPADGAVVSNAGFTVRWEPGSASNGAGTGTGLYCRVNGGAWDLRAGFGDNTERGMPNYAPGTRIECKVRTRLNSDYATWVDSAVVGWTASDASAQMRILGITLEDDPGRDACDIIRFSARVRNEGVEEEGWEARVFLHRVGGSPEDADAVEGERSYTVVVAPGQENDVPMVIDPALPIPVGVGLEMTLRLADEARGLGEPVQMTIPLEGVDVAPPVIERFDVYGVGGEPEGLIAGRSQAISLQVRDEYQLDEVRVEWRTQGGAWAPAQLETARRVCERSYFTAGSFDLPGNLAAGTLLEIRLRVVDLAGHVTERVLPAQVRVPNTPVVRFVTPVGGERHRYSYRAAVDCVQTRFFVSSPIPIRTLSFGLGSASARDLPTDVSSGIQTERTTVNPIPADGWVEGCVRTGTRGDDIRVVVRIYDDNREYHYFVSPPVTIDDVKPPAPWGELRLEPSQRRRPVLADGSQPALSFGDARLEGGRVVMYRHDSEPFNEFQPVEDPIDGLHWITRLEFDPVDFRLLSSTPILTRYEHRSDPTFEAGLVWQGFGDEFQAFSHQKDDPDCENFQVPCDFTLATRRLSQGQVGPIAIVDRYPGIQGLGPGAREVLSMADGTQLLHLNLHRTAGATSSLYRRAGGEWSLLSAYQFSIHELHRVGNEAWAFRLETEADRHVVRRRTLNPQTGAVTATEDLLAFPRTQSSLMSTAVMQLTGALHFVAADLTNRHLWVGAHDGQRWTVGPQRTLPPVWRGQPVDAVHIRPLIKAGPWVEVQLPLAEGAVNFLLPVAPGNAPDFDRMFERIDDREPAVMANGRLLRVVTLDWNYEPRLFFQPALANEGCYDANPCTTDDWDAVAGRCVYAPIECAQDGDACNGIEICNPATGQCGPGEAANCDDGQACNGVEGCDPATGECLAGVPVVVNDGVACTVDACDPETGRVVNTPSDEGCVPSACAVAACRPGAPGADGSGCVEEARVVADDGLACTVGRCDPATGRVFHEPVGACLIGGVCVAAGAANPENTCEICNPADPLRWSAAAAACDDGRFCTVDDRCVNRVCVGVARDCSGLIEDPACQRAPCDEAGDRCRVESLVDGAPCEDGDLCNGRETCRAGRCSAEEVPPLASENPCIAFECDPVLGVQAVNVDAACDADADPCTVGDRCAEGECLVGAPLDCSQLDAGCARGRCVVENGAAVCAPEPIAEGEACDDDAACTQGDRCVAGVCRGEAFACRPAGICERPESGACDGEGGCTYEPVADETPCPGGVCEGGRCAVAGDECREALVLAGGGRLVLELSHATPSPVAPACFAEPTQPDVWLRFAGALGRTYTVHVRSLGGTRLAAEVTDACPAGAPCLDGLEVGAGEEAVLGPFRVAVPSERLVRLQARCCEAPRAEVWLEVQGDVVPCPVGTDGCACHGDGTCDEGLACAAGTCAEPVCPMGSAGCACRAGACDQALVCEDGLCRAAPGCVEGSLGCACRAAGACDGALACEGGLCVEAMACAPGTEGCGCYGNGTCNAGLRCAGGACETCPAGTEGCGCYGNGSCNEGLRCSEDQCAACPPGGNGCACYGNGTCDAGLVCDQGRCGPRPPQDAAVADAAVSEDRGVDRGRPEVGIDSSADGTTPDAQALLDAAPLPDGGPPSGGDGGCRVESAEGDPACAWPLLALIALLYRARRRLRITG